MFSETLKKFTSLGKPGQRKGEGREAALLPGADSGKIRGKPGPKPDREPLTTTDAVP